MNYRAINNYSNTSNPLLSQRIATINKGKKIALRYRVYRGARNISGGLVDFISFTAFVISIVAVLAI